MPPNDVARISISESESSAPFSTYNGGDRLCHVDGWLMFLEEGRGSGEAMFD
jgi:environmental stress-induced protein Ves